MRGRTELSDASLILTSVKPELKVGGTLQARTFLAPFGCEEIKVVHGEEEDGSAGTLIKPIIPEGTDNEKQGPSSSEKDMSEGDDGQGGSRQAEEPMQQDASQAGGEDDRASTGGISSLDFNIFSDRENSADTLEATEPANEGISTLVPQTEMTRKLPESSSPGNSRKNEQRILMNSRRIRRIEGSARVPFLETLPEEVWEVHHRDHESRTGCRLDRVAFMEEVWTVVPSYGTQSILKKSLNRPLMREILDKLDECEGRLSELLIDSATDESEENSPIKMTPQDDKGEVVYLSRTRRGTMRSKLVVDKIN